MSIQKRPDGKYRARVVGDDGRERARHFAKLSDAKRWHAEQLAAKNAGQWVDPNSKVTFLSFYETWAARQLWETGTVRAMDLAARSTTFARVPLVRVRRRHVEEWVKQMTTDGLAPGTIKTRVGNVRNVLRAAVRDRMIGIDPSEGVVLPRQRRREASIVLPTSAQVGAILRESHDHFRAFVALGAFAGLRLGEAAALRVVDVDFGARTIRIDHQVQRTTGYRTEIKRPKFGSERVVYMADGLASLLREHIERYKLSGLMWIFPGEAEYPVHQNSVGYLWRKACKLAQVDGVRFHDLRHWYASGLIAAGCDVATVQRALGHSSATTTLATYAHLWPKAEDRTRAAVQNMIAEIHGLTADRDWLQAA